MRKEIFTIATGSGLQERAAALLTDVANRFSCNISIEYAGRSLNCKSFLSVLSLAIPDETPVTFTCEGIDEDAAIIAIEKFCNSST